MRNARSDRGQASPEWLGLVLLVALAMSALAAFAGIPGFVLARAVADRLLCAAHLEGGCGEEGELGIAYGPDLAALVTGQEPVIAYEDGMRALPVDFRSCRSDTCAEGPDSGATGESLTGERATVFVHAVDCREPDPTSPYDCSGARAGNVYLQYWLYYPGSQTSRALLGDKGFHDDDWEGFQVRVGPDETDARATSHHGYNYRGGAGSWASDLGVVHRSAWGRDPGTYFVSGGSHAGHVLDLSADAGRWTEPGALRLVPIESLDREALRTEFAITPPWRKKVYRDPEYQGTD